jgi:uncharacterized membrane protein/mono/diheme cytochrome c family protein
MLQFLGRLHPLVVHFPVALLCAAAVLELLRRRREGPSQAGFACLVLGAASALVAVLTGWLFAEHDPPGVAELVLRHRWTGVALAVIACGTALLARRWAQSADPGLALSTRVGLAATLALVCYSAHLGGAMVYGEGFLLEALRGEGGEEAGGTAETRSTRGPEGEAGGGPQEDGTGAGGRVEGAIGVTAVAEESAATPVSESAAAPVDYLGQVRPLLEARCFECHGEKRRPKGDLRLTDMAAVLARPPGEAVIVPGDPEASVLYQRIVLPAEHEDVMPAKGDPLAAEEIALLREWIAQGAPWEPVADSSARDEEAGGEPPAGLRLDARQAAARDAALERLHAAGALAMRVAETSEEVEVDLSVTPELAGDAELALLAGLEPCLVSLVLARTAVSDAGLERLAGFQALRKLRLEHTAIGDAGLAWVARLSALESLNLFHTRVTDAGLGELTRLARLQRLYVGETAVTEQGALGLQGALPGLVVERGVLPAPPPPPDGAR